MTNDEAIEELKRQYLGDSERIIQAKNMAIEVLKNQKTGHWIRLHEDYPECDFEFKGCSVCRTHYPNFAVEQFRYCPNCGVKMEDQDEKRGSD